MPGPWETSASGRRQLLRERWPMHAPGPFLMNLQRSWRRCEAMRRRGAPAAEIGLAFHRALGEIFGRDQGDVRRTQISESSAS
jgi:hypothetical protein